MSIESESIYNMYLAILTGYGQVAADDWVANNLDQEDIKALQAEIDLRERKDENKMVAFSQART